MGADEYMLGSDFAKYPQILEVRAGEVRSERHTAGRLHRLRQPRPRLRGLQGQAAAHLERRTHRCHTVPVSGRDDGRALAERGARSPANSSPRATRLMNAAYSLYLVRGGFHSDTEALYEQSWDPRSFEGEKLASADGITGAKISLWPDNGRGETENEVAVALWPALRHIAQATWGDPHPDATYAGFTARGTAVGHAPGLPGPDPGAGRRTGRTPCTGRPAGPRPPRSGAPPTATQRADPGRLPGGARRQAHTQLPAPARRRGDPADLRPRRTPCSAGSWSRRTRAATGSSTPSHR